VLTPASPACYGRFNRNDMIDGFWLSTLILMAMTFGIIYFRYATTVQASNWPLVYYAFTVLHIQLYPEGINQNVLFAAILAAMLIRFEFMAGWFLKLIETVEYICLLLIAYSLFLILF
jgi:hypothetical protein